jgi:transcriptional regulator of arginine metabolism
VKSQRRRYLLRILQEGRAQSQADIVDALRAAGHDVTQATVSRDLRELGAAKVLMRGSPVYRLPDDIPRPGVSDLVSRSLARTLGEFAVTIEPAHSLVVISTAPGHAAAVARAIDLSGTTEVVGTVAGDDTIFVAAPDPQTAHSLAAKWRGVAADLSEVKT